MRTSSIAVVALLFLSAISANATEFMTGWNQGWIMDKYGTQWVAGFDQAEFGKVLDLAKDSGAGRVRFWLFEGFQSDALIWQGGKARGVNPKFFENLRTVIKMAKKRNLKLNLTLFDGNISHNTAPSIDYKNYFWDIFNDLNGERGNFLNQIFLPLLQMLSEPEVRETVDQLDLMNEIDSATRGDADIRFENGWTAANSLICEVSNFKKGSGLASFTKFTASVGWSGAESLILNNQPWPECVDFFDLHLYNDQGNIPKARELVKFAAAHGKEIQLGEFGQSWSQQSDWLQSEVTKNFIRNARDAGFSAAMAWRLKGSADGERFLYQSGDTLRPAFEDFKKASKGIVDPDDAFDDEYDFAP